jgi:hypothetical protein
MPGLALLEGINYADVLSVSCGSAGSCDAGGSYGADVQDVLGFVASRTTACRARRRASRPEQTARLTPFPAPPLAIAWPAEVQETNDYYYYYPGSQQGFLADERNGRWGNVTSVPGLKALNVGRNADVSSVSCSSAGNCAAGGYFGAWNTPIPLPGLAALNKGGAAEVASVSFSSPDGCAAAGFYTDSSGHRHGFVTQAG